MASTDGAAERSPIEVLLVEDDPGDIMMTREAFAERNIRNVLNVVTDGDAAIAYVRRTGQYQNATRPDLVVLDLNLPRRSGHEVLADLKSDPDLCDIPIVVLTTSEAQEDIVGSYRRHANAYVRKPVDFDRFLAVVAQIDDFFASLVLLPPRTT
jgi:CheY-like chemotaxis protein